MAAIDLGQLIVEGDHLSTGDDSDLHLVLTDGSSLVLGPDTEIIVGRKNDFTVLRGLAWVMGEGPAKLQIASSCALASSAKSAFEFSVAEDETAVTVQEGLISFSDPGHKKTVEVHPYEQASASPGRLNPAFRLPKRDLGDFEQRWERSRMIHGQRAQLMAYFETQKKQREKALKARLPGLRRRQKPDGTIQK
jgi:ferric-dicitrate binding protein FerR (iron transport regulator)